VFLGVSYGIGIIGINSPENVQLWLSSTLGSTLNALVVYALAALITVMPLWRRVGSFKKLAEKLGLVKFQPGRMFIWAVFAWGLSMVASFVVVAILLALNIPGLDLAQEQQIGFTTTPSPTGYILIFFVLVILAPVAEEVLFRGYLFRRLRTVFGFAASAVITSAVFAGLHVQPNVVINVFILSLFLCYLAEKFDSIWAGVMVHMLKNGLAYLMLFILPLYGISVG
jgi:membrane protease YdiL (CAAX protease family)